MNRIFCILLMLLTFTTPPLQAQELHDSSSINKVRLGLFTASSASLYATSLIVLNEMWYKGYPKSGFHFTNDNDQWMQIDKLGHAFTAYYQSLIGIEGLKWSGVDDRKSIIYGSLFGIIFQTPIEILDGFSANWGASWGDLVANTMGSALAFSQYYFWNEQKVLFRLSFMPTVYGDMRTDVFGNNLPSKILKDYNGHNFWLSFPINFINPRIPEWLCLSIGYGAEEMLAGSKRTTASEFIHYNPYRQFYLSLDINTLKIPTKHKWLKAILVATSMIKIPAPALEFNSRNEFRFHPLHF